MDRLEDYQQARLDNSLVCLILPAGHRLKATALASSLRAEAVAAGQGMRDRLATQYWVRLGAHWSGLEIFHRSEATHSQQLITIVTESFRNFLIQSFLLDFELCSRQYLGSYAVSFAKQLFEMELLDRCPGARANAGPSCHYASEPTFVPKY